MSVEDLLRQNEHKDLLRLITAGSVDDGKSTLIGRLLYEANGIYEDQLSSVRKASGRRGSAAGELDLSLVTDGLKAEREQGITIDVAYRYFSTPGRKFIIADTPGHEQYTRNMVTGASTASLMIILIDASKGLLVQSRRHAFIASLLGIRHIVVAVNKMDLVDYSREVFDHVREDFTEFAAKLEATDVTFIPVSALAGDNVVSRGKKMPWYQGTTLMNHLQTVHVASDRNLIDLRFPVQYVLRLDDRNRAYMGTAASGVIRPGDEVLVLPEGTRSKVKRVFGPDGDLAEGFPPLALGVELEDQIDISRGRMLVHPSNAPRVENHFDAMLVWMAAEGLQPDRPYYLKHLARTVSATVPAVRYRIDVNTLHRQEAHTLALNEIGRVQVSLAGPLAFDSYARNQTTGAFVLIDRVTHGTVAAGMILDRQPSEVVTAEPGTAAAPRSRHVRSHQSLISPADRAGRLRQTPVAVWLTGLTFSGKTTIAGLLEKSLFEAGYTACVVNGENMRLGISKDLAFSAVDRTEQIRRAAEIAKILNAAGLIAICDLLSPSASDRAAAREVIGPGRFIETYLSAPLAVCRSRDAEGLYDLAERGEVKMFSGLTAPYDPPAAADLILPTHQLPAAQCVELIVKILKDRGFLL